MGVAWIALVLGLLIVGFVWSWRRDPRRWLHGVLLLAIVWYVLATGLQALPWSSLQGWAAVVTLAFPWLLSILLGVALIANGVVMLRREGRSLGNVLSLLLGLAVVAGAATGVALFWLGSGFESGSMLVVALGVVVLVLPGYVALSLASYVLYCMAYLRRRPRVRPEAVVVLGAGLIRGEVTRLLARRLDTTLDVCRHLDASGSPPLVVASGGQGGDEAVAESEAMTAYLRAHGLDPHRIRSENRSTNTRENLTFSRQLLDAEGVTGPVRVVTSSYHVGRAALLARSLGLQADVVGAPTAWYFVPSGFIREFVAVVVQHRLVNALGLAVWTAFTGLTAYAIIVG